MTKTALVYRPEVLLHETGQHHPEAPARVEAIMTALDRSGMALPILEIAPAAREELLRVHTEEHVETIWRTCAHRYPYIDLDTTMSRGSWNAALLAVGGAIDACNAVLDRRYDNVFWVMRPPGHHAEIDHAMGFCLFNNAAIAAKWLVEEAGLKRVAIFDFDIHHGNGTQHATYDDDRIYYISIHQHPHYPGTGYPDERGKNNTNLNIQMPPGCAPEEWFAAMDNMVIPALAGFDPEFLILSAGFDAHRLDPLGRQLLESEHFAEITRRVKPVANGRIVSLLEGGYNLKSLAESAVAHVRALHEDNGHGQAGQSQ
jgi:acetoin utilization deacetylase AcuC-like enzyme